MTAEPGLVGKLPAHGDFVRRGPASTTARLDAWLAEEVDALGAELDDVGPLLASMPSWRFVIADGDQWLTGALGPSEDKVGRCYPFMAFIRTDSAASEPLAARVAAAVDDARPTASADMLIERLAVLGDEQGGGPGDGDRWWRDGSDVEPMRLSGLPRGADFVRLVEDAA